MGELFTILESCRKIQRTAGAFELEHDAIHPSRTNYMMESTSSDEIQQSIYEDPDALLPDDTHQDQPKVKAKPVPAPRFKLYQQTQHNSTSNNAESSGSITTAATSSGYPAGYKRPKPARPAPTPPVKTEKRTAAIEESSQTSNAQPPVKQPSSSCPTSRSDQSCLQPPDLHIKQPPRPPPRPDRFPTSPAYYDKPSSSVSQRHENTSALQSRPSSASSTYLTRVSPALSQESLDVTGTNYGAQNIPPPLPLNPPPLRPLYGGSVYSEISNNHYLEILPDNPNETDINELLNWFNRVLTYSDSIPLSLYGLSKEDEMRSISQRAMNAAKARRLYNFLMMKRKEDLQKIIADFKSICEHLNKIKKKKKNMDIAGGTTGAAGGVAAVVGIALAPVTMGTSLIVTAVGAGMIASAGGMGAHAAIASKKTVTRAAVEKLVNDYKEGVTDLEHCLNFIICSVMELRRHGIARLESAGAHPDAVRMAYKFCNVLSNMDIYGGRSACPGGMSSEKLLQAFTKEMDLYFTEKNGQKLKKSNKSIFSGKVCLLADGLEEGLNHLNDMWEKLT